MSGLLDSLFSRKRDQSPSTTPEMGSLKPQPGFGAPEYLFFEGMRCEPLYHGEATPTSTQLLLSSHERGVRTETGAMLLPWKEVREACIDLSAGMVFLWTVHAPQWDPVTLTDKPSFFQSDRYAVFESWGEVSAIDLSPDGAELAVLEWVGSVGSGILSLVDVTSGRRTFLSDLGSISGGPLSWSPDGAWILAHSGTQAVLVSRESGQKVSLTEEDRSRRFDWWPHQGSSALLFLDGQGSDQYIGALDLATGDSQKIVDVELPPTDLPAMRQFLSKPRVSPDGRRVLVGSPFGPSASYQERFASRSRTAMIDTSDGKLIHPFSAFADGDEMLEREHDAWRWVWPIDVPSPMTVEVADTLMASAEGPGVDHALGCDRSVIPTSVVATPITFAP